MFKPTFDIPVVNFKNISLILNKLPEHSSSKNIKDNRAAAVPVFLATFPPPVGGYAASSRVGYNAWLKFL